MHLRDAQAKADRKQIAALSPAPSSPNGEMAEPFTRAVLNLPGTKTLIEQLRQSPWLRKVCGMDSVPSKATFSRAFSFFAEQGLGDMVHQALLSKFVSGEESSRPLVLHISHDAKWLRHLRDSTAVEGRERVVKKTKKPLVEKKTR